MLQKNKFLANLKAGRKTSACQLYFPSATVVELIGLAGFECVHFDGEHGTFTPENVDDLCRVAELYGMTPTARVPEISEAAIQSYLDRGVMGIFGPGVDTKEDAQKLVDACRYSPIGKRGNGGAPRWLRYGNIASKKQIEEANAEILVVAFLEHTKAIDNLDDIMSVEGIDAYYVGPADMSLSLGLPGELGHPKVKEAEDKVRQAALARGRYYFGDYILGSRATNLFLDGARLFFEANREALS